jgi:MinD-like ATPase involved in chromosome partitioning or flagellar assembly
LAAEAKRHGHDVVLRSSGDDDVRAGCEAAEPEWLIVVASENALTVELLTHCDSRGIRLLAVTVRDADRRHAAEIGVFECVAVDAPWMQFESGLVERLRDPGQPTSRLPSVPAIPQRVDTRALGTEDEDSSESASAGESGNASAGSLSDSSEMQGSVIAVWGAAGAPGRTTLAIAIAAELAARGFSVALCDADPYSASIAPTLGILDEAPGFAAACRLAGNETLTIAELQRIGSRYGSPATGFWVLTGINSPHRWPELSAQRVEGTLAQCRSWVDFTIVDTGFSIESDEEISTDLFAPRRNAATITALAHADQVVAVGAADPVGLSRFLRAYSDLLELAHTDRVTVVINKLRSSAVGLNPVGQVQQTLKRFGRITDAVHIPHDHVAMDTALLAGRTLREVAPKSAMRQAITQLVVSRLLT